MTKKIEIDDNFIIDNHLKEKLEFEKKVEHATSQNNNSVKSYTNNLILINTVLLTAMIILLGGYKYNHSAITAFIIVTLILIVAAIITALINSIIEQNFFGSMIKVNNRIVRRLSIKSDGKTLEILEPREINTIVIEEQSGIENPPLFFFWSQSILTSLAVISFFVVLILVISLSH